MPYLVCPTDVMEDTCRWSWEGSGDFDLDRFGPVKLGNATQADLDDFYKSITVYNRNNVDDLPETIFRDSYPFFINYKLKEKIEELEPNTHRFLPIEINVKGESLVYYFLYTENKLKSIVYDNTNFREGLGYESARKSGFRPRLCNYDEGLCTLRKEICANNHFWRGVDEENSLVFFCSDEIGDFYLKNNMKGWNLKKCILA